MCLRMKQSEAMERQRKPGGGRKKMKPNFNSRASLKACICWMWTTTKSVPTVISGSESFRGSSKKEPQLSLDS